MLQRFCQYITDKDLFSPTSQKIMLAISGGIDSVVMAKLFSEAGFNFSIAHCNFKLRGEESEADEAFVEEMAKNYKVPFFRTSFETLKFAEQKKVSIQMAARDLRYDWLKTTIKLEGYDFVATAHHRNDVIETVLLNLTKGTGIHGLVGIREKKESIIRPLLFASREEIKAFAEKHQIKWREDSSNASIKYQRNLIRHKVIPVLKEINPGMEATFEETSEKLRAAENIFNEKIQNVRSSICHSENGDFKINISELLKEKESKFILFELLKDFGFNYHDSENLLESTHVGKKIESPTHIAIRDRQYFIISSKLEKPNETEYLIEKDMKEIITSDMKLKFMVAKKEGFSIPTSQDVACLDLGKLEFPLILRNWQNGDWLHPLGLAKKKKISDLLIDNKVPIHKKDSMKVLLSDGKMAWAVGLRLDDRFKITGETTEIFVIKTEKL